MHFKKSKALRVLIILTLHALAVDRFSIRAISLAKPLLRRKRDSQLQKFREGFGKVLEEQIFILHVHLDVLLELRVGHQNHVGGQHHQLTGAILELIGTFPRFPIMSHLW